MKFSAACLAALSAAALLSACVTSPAGSPAPVAASPAAAFESDRKAILAMAGDYRVRFDFIETVALAEDYELKEQKISGAYEIVRVIADDGEFISLQHILVVGGEDKFPIKHWRQDWVYEPAHIFEFAGANAWEKRALSPAERKGKWAQFVYQVDDGPRYAALAEWTHENGVSSWAGESWRPLPRRDATTRDDYHAIEAVNRHVITPEGWAHEQDNTKLVLSGGSPRALVREVGVNTYRHSEDFETEIADAYWEKTKDFWAVVRAEWTRYETDFPSFALTIQGEPEELYMKLLDLAEKVEKDEQDAASAAEDALAVMARYVTTDVAPLEARLMQRKSGEE
ncbi:MAG: hypothetical protein RIC52_17615 [Amphiplicatus sp.]